MHTLRPPPTRHPSPESKPNSLPTCSLPPNATALPQPVPPAAAPARGRSFGRSLRSSTAIPAPTRAPRGSGGEGSPKGAASSASLLPSGAMEAKGGASRPAELPPEASARPLAGAAAPSRGAAGSRPAGWGRPRAAPCPRPFKKCGFLHEQIVIGHGGTVFN